MKAICPICSNMDLGIEDKELDLYYCKSCNHVFAPRTRELAKSHYSKYVRDYQKEKESGGRYGYDTVYIAYEHKNYFKHPNHKLYSYIFGKLPKGNIRLLDVSCGNASLLNYLYSKTDQIELYGIDLMDNSHPAINFIKGDIFTTEISGKFDVVVCKDIVEHTDDIRKFMHMVKKMVKDDGIVFITTRDMGAFLFKVAKFIKPLWRFPYERWHRYYNINYFTEESLKRLVKNEGFEIIEKKYYGIPLKSIDLPYENNFLQKFYKVMAMALFSLSYTINQKPNIIFSLKKSIKK